MRVTVTGWARTHGTGKQSGAAYDMGRLFVLNELSPIDTAKTKRECAGFEVVELPLDSLGVVSVKALNGQSFPVQCDLGIENQLRFNGKEQALVGVVVNVQVAGPRSGK